MAKEKKEEEKAAQEPEPKEGQKGQAKVKPECDFCMERYGSPKCVCSGFRV